MKRIEILRHSTQYTNRQHAISHIFYLEVNWISNLSSDAFDFFPLLHSHAPLTPVLLSCYIYILLNEGNKGRVWCSNIYRVIRKYNKNNSDQIGIKKQCVFLPETVLKRPCPYSTKLFFCSFSSSQCVISAEPSMVTVHKDGSMNVLCVKPVHRKEIGQDFPLIFNVHSFTCSVTFS